MLFVGQTLVSSVNSSTSRCAGRGRIPAARGLVPASCRSSGRDSGARWPGPARTACQNSWASGSRMAAGMRGEVLLAGRVPCAGSSRAAPAAPGPARRRRDRTRRSPRSPAAGRRQACLVPGDVLPPGIEVILVAVGNGHSGEPGQDPGVFHGVQAPGSEPNAEYSSVNAPWTYFFSPAGPARSVVSSNPATGGGGDQGADQRDHAGGQRRRLRQAGVDEPVRDRCAGHVGDQQPAPLHRHVLENHQVNRQRPQPRPDDSAESGTPAGRGAACSSRRRTRPCRSCCTRSAGRGRDLLLLKRPGNTQVSGIRQVPRRTSRPLGVVVLGPVRDLPAHRRARAARLLPPLSSSPPAPRPAAASSAASAPAGHPTTAASRSSRCSATPPAPPPTTAPAGQRPSPPAPRSAPPARRFPAASPAACSRISASRGSPQRRIGHSPKSSPKPRTATTATPRPPPKRNQPSLTAAPAPGESRLRAAAIGAHDPGHPPRRTTAWRPGSGNITFDCGDALKLATFWSAVLGRPLDDGSSEFFDSIGGADAERLSALPGTSTRCPSRSGQRTAFTSTW